MSVVNLSSEVCFVGLFSLFGYWRGTISLRGVGNNQDGGRWGIVFGRAQTSCRSRYVFSVHGYVVSLIIECSVYQSRLFMGLNNLQCLQCPAVMRSDVML